MLYHLNILVLVWTNKNVILTNEQTVGNPIK